MTVYSITCDSDIYHYYTFLIKIEQSLSTIRSLNGDRLKYKWSPVPVRKIYMENEGCFTEVDGRVAFTKKAKEVLEPYISSFTEFLPLTHGKEEIYLLNVLELIPLNKKSLN